MTSLSNDYIRGLEKGLAIIKDMREYEVDSDIPDMEEYVHQILDLIVADYMEHIETIKAEMLKRSSE